MPLHAYTSPIKAQQWHLRPASVCVGGEEADLTPHDAPHIQVPGCPRGCTCSWCGGHRPHGQGTPGSPWWAGPGVWVGLDVKQLRGEAEVRFSGAGEMSILSWAGEGEPVCTFLGVSTWGPLPLPHTLSSGQGSDPPTMPSGGSIFQVLWQEVTLNSCCSLPSLRSSAHIPV